MEATQHEIMKVCKLVWTVARMPKKEVKEREKRNEKNEMFRNQPRSDREKNGIGKVGAI